MIDLEQQRSNEVDHLPARVGTASNKINQTTYEKIYSRTEVRSVN